MTMESKTNVHYGPKSANLIRHVSNDRGSIRNSRYLFSKGASDHSRPSLHTRQHDQGDGMGCCAPPTPTTTTDETLSLCSIGSSNHIGSLRSSVLSRYGNPEDYIQNSPGNAITRKKPFPKTSPSPSFEHPKRKILHAPDNIKIPRMVVATPNTKNRKPQEDSSSHSDGSSDHTPPLTTYERISKRSPEEAYSFYGKLGSFMINASFSKKKLLQKGENSARSSVSRPEKNHMVLRQAAKDEFRQEAISLSHDEIEKDATRITPHQKTEGRFLKQQNGIGNEKTISEVPREIIASEQPPLEKHDSDKTMIEPSRVMVHSIVDEIINMELKRRLVLATRAATTNHQKSKPKEKQSSQVKEESSNEEEVSSSDYSLSVPLDEAYTQLSNVMEGIYTEFEMDLNSIEKLKEARKKLIRNNNVFTYPKFSVEEIQGTGRKRGNETSPFQNSTLSPQNLQTNNSANSLSAPERFSAVLDDFYSQFEYTLDQLYDQYEEDLERSEGERHEARNIDKKDNRNPEMRGTGIAYTPTRTDVQRHKRLLDFWQSKTSGYDTDRN